ncbi:ABC transporter ATP-binding protein [Chloroflexus sp. Y-396-1]|uniref:ABC transporter ATP-binding protein n=1 Tax=Chloroflexus sp. Y-396-1 TaxID=867845 RepID=UPI000490B61D|nr:ABC transporter ATP-binding protein [Chloroflexus sp. Y-396-1]
MPYAIRARDLAKQYRIGAIKQRSPGYATLRDAIVERFRGQPSAETTELWALNGVSFDIQQGEVVGIIGRNGAGKSTLLKVLSRITEPTRGRAELYGRVASLLEVGTGFHPELTGRENIYLNGAILGMRKREIDRNFDAIVHFAEVEKFIDTPVKFYSSGMYVRLAFAVAAHLEPEILIVDEVLAVGDARFQKKCLNKMQDVGQQGRTVLFVSHSMQSILRMCQRAILLHQGQVIADGPAQQVVGVYLGKGAHSIAERVWPDREKAPGKDIAHLRAVRVRDVDGDVSDTIDIRTPVTLEMEFVVSKGGYVLMPHFRLYNEDNVAVFTTLDLDPEWRGRPRPPGRYTARVTIPGNFLAEGSLYVEAALTTLDPPIGQFAERDAVAFQVIDSLEGNTARGDWAGNLSGVVRPLLPWSTVYEPIG